MPKPLWNITQIAKFIASNDAIRDWFNGRQVQMMGVRSHLDTLHFAISIAKKDSFYDIRVRLIHHTDNLIECIIGGGDGLMGLGVVKTFWQRRAVAHGANFEIAFTNAWKCFEEDYDKSIQKWNRPDLETYRRLRLNCDA